MYRLEPRENAREPLIAARAGPAALQAKTETLSDDVQVRQMCNAPAASVRWRPIKGRQIARLIHRGVSKPPQECGRCQIHV